MVSVGWLDQPQVTAPAAGATVPSVDDQGWYLYGLTPADGAQATTLDAVPQLNDEPVRYLHVGRLCAIVRRVPLAEFTGQSLRAHVQDAVWLEAMVRHHHEVLAQVHHGRTVLPSKFGCVYRSAEELEAALAHLHDAVLARLEDLAECDEWGAQLAITGAALDRLVQQHDASLQALQQEMATATPGRAYLLRRRLADVRTAARERAADALALEVYDGLRQYARSSELSSPAPAAQADEDSADAPHTVMRAVFLVPRASADIFLVQVEHVAARVEGLQCTFSGPWPPYSFATLPEGGENE